MIGLDTNILARYYIADAADASSEKQRALACNLIESGRPLKIAKTVLLELEWVMRGYYKFESAQILQTFRHLLAQTHITIEDRQAVLAAIEGYSEGLDFADALHHASYADCDSMASFDDHRFARRAQRLGLLPRVSVPTS